MNIPSNYTVECIVSNSNTLPLFKFRVLHAVRESFTTDTDTFKYTIASELAKNKARVHDARLFHFVRNDTTDEVRFGVAKVCHQFVQLFSVQCRDSLEAATLPLFLLTATSFEQYTK